MPTMGATSHGVKALGVQNQISTLDHVVKQFYFSLLT